MVALPDGDNYISSMNTTGAREGNQRERTVLVADDETGVRTILKFLLTRNGFHVYSASDGNEAVEIFRAHPNEIGIVLLDVQMPVMNGPCALGKIRAIAPDVQAVITSGMLREEVMREFEMLPPWTFLAKPFVFNEVDQIFPKAA
jgi:two-component system, cell cycle sensor histidine kinase and response regulator CckA